MDPLGDDEGCLVCKKDYDPTSDTVEVIEREVNKNKAIRVLYDIYHLPKTHFSEMLTCSYLCYTCIERLVSIHGACEQIKILESKIIQDKREIETDLIKSYLVQKEEKKDLTTGFSYTRSTREVLYPLIKLERQNEEAVVNLMSKYMRKSTRLPFEECDGEKQEINVKDDAFLRDICGDKEDGSMNDLTQVLTEPFLHLDFGPVDTGDLQNLISPPPHIDNNTQDHKEGIDGEIAESLKEITDSVEDRLEQTETGETVVKVGEEMPILKDMSFEGGRGETGRQSNGSSSGSSTNQNSPPEIDREGSIVLEEYFDESMGDESNQEEEERSKMEKLKEECVIRCPIIILERDSVEKSKIQLAQIKAEREKEKESSGEPRPISPDIVIPPKKRKKRSPNTYVKKRGRKPKKEIAQQESKVEESPESLTPPPPEPVAPPPPEAVALPPEELPSPQDEEQKELGSFEEKKDLSPEPPTPDMPEEMDTTPDTSPEFSPITPEVPDVSEPPKKVRRGRGPAKPKSKAAEKVEKSKESLKEINKNGKIGKKNRKKMELNTTGIVATSSESFFSTSTSSITKTSPIPETSRSFKCTNGSCDKTFKTEISQKKHMKKCPQTPPPPNFRCPILTCPIMFMEKGELIAHLRIHN